MSTSTYAMKIGSAEMLNVGAALLIVSITARAVYLFYLHPLSNIPGPPHWIFSRLPFVWTLRQGHFAIRMKQLHEKYGPVVRIASNEVSFIDKDAWHDMFSYQTNFTKSPYWYRIRPNGSWGIMAAPNPDHRRFRRAFAPAFTEKAVQEQKSMILRHIDILITELKKEISGGENATDFLKWLEYITFDILGDLCFSESFNCLANDENRPQIDTLQMAIKAFTFVVIPRILGVEMAWNWIATKVSLLIRKRVAYNKSLNYLTHKRLAEGDTINKNDLMTFVCRSTAEKGLSTTEAENALGDFLIAGSETVATTLAAIFYHILRDSEINQQLTKEVRQAFHHESAIGGKVLSELHLLDAVINEAMRLAPSLPTVLPRIVPEPGAYVCGHWFPAGSLLTFSQLAAYYSPANFSSPEKFIPSRWLSGSTMNTHETAVFQPFSLGPRNCIGKEFALLEVKLIVAKLLWNFDMNDGGLDWDWNSQKTFLIWEKKPLKVRLTLREVAAI